MGTTAQILYRPKLHEFKRDFLSSLFCYLFTRASRMKMKEIRKPHLIFCLSKLARGFQSCTP